MKEYCVVFPCGLVTKVQGKQEAKAIANAHTVKLYIRGAKHTKSCVYESDTWKLVWSTGG